MHGLQLGFFNLEIIWHGYVIFGMLCVCSSHGHECISKILCGGVFAKFWCRCVIRKLSRTVEQFSPLHSCSRIVLIACTSRPVGVMNQWASSFVSWHIFPRFSICMQLDRLYLSFALWLLTWEVLVSFFWLKIPTLPTQFWGFIWLILYMRVHLGMVYGLNRTLKQNSIQFNSNLFTTNIT